MNYLEKLIKTFITYSGAKKEDVAVVWFSKTLNNAKAIMIDKTKVEKGFIYELTYNGDTGETYIDAYIKFNNEVYKD